MYLSSTGWTGTLWPRYAWAMPASNPRTGVLLVNLGTPDTPEVGAVRRYLRQFLSDPRVIDLPAVMRWALVELAVLPWRPATTAAAYRKIWGTGSPLLMNSQALATAVQERIGPEVRVELAMRYGKPAIAAALDRLEAWGAEAIVVLPLYPQYASSSTGSSLEEIYRWAAGRWNTPALRIVPPFYADAGYLEAFTRIAEPLMQAERPDFWLFSFHGLPERQIRRCDRAGHCFTAAACCEAPGKALGYCYRAQCFVTARELATRLGLPSDRYAVSFQSRLGRTPWIRPYTDLLLPEILAEGHRRIAVMVPSFTADCLETLEEIGIRAREDFLSRGGEALWLVHSLNAHPAWVEAVVGLVTPLLAASSDRSDVARIAIRG